MIIADLHTHTQYSDGKDTLEQMVAAAKQKGLLQIANTEHGLRHAAFGLRRRNIPALLSEVDRLRNANPDIEILIGIEANMYSSYGDIDLLPKDYGILDFVCAGYHQAAVPKNPVDAIRYNYPGVFRFHFSQKQIDTYTKTYINVIRSGKVQFITHPCYGLPINVREVAKAAYDYGVFLELNGKKVSMTDDEVLSIVDVGTTIIVNSDAHSASRVGDFFTPMAVVERLNIDKKRIVNWDKKVVFNKKNPYTK